MDEHPEAARQREKLKIKRKNLLKAKERLQALTRRGTPFSDNLEEDHREDQYDFNGHEGASQHEEDGYDC
jgi:hypothetical protein